MYIRGGVGGWGLGCGALPAGSAVEFCSSLPLGEDDPGVGVRV
jgi:hypothetical protein